MKKGPSTVGLSAFQLSTDRGFEINAENVDFSLRAGVAATLAETHTGESQKLIS